MNDNSFDCIVIGAGTAGLSASLSLARYRRKVLTLHNGKPRNIFSQDLHFTFLSVNKNLNFVHGSSMCDRSSWCGSFNHEFQDPEVASADTHRAAVRVLKTLRKVRAS